MGLIDNAAAAGRGSNDAFEEDYRTMVVMIAGGVELKCA